jgi:hypothetical protein
MAFGFSINLHNLEFVDYSLKLFIYPRIISSSSSLFNSSSFGLGADRLYVMFPFPSEATSPSRSPSKKRFRIPARLPHSAPFPFDPNTFKHHTKLHACFRQLTASSIFAHVDERWRDTKPGACFRYLPAWVRWRGPSLRRRRTPVFDTCWIWGVGAS